MGLYISVSAAGALRPGSMVESSAYRGTNEAMLWEVCCLSLNGLLVQLNVF